jgi:sulfur carrier protein
VSNPPSRATALVPIVLNGAEQSIAAGSTVQDLLRGLGAKGRVAVALNRDVVPRSRFTSQRIVGGDRIEILEAVGGG